MPPARLAVVGRPGASSRNCASGACAAARSTPDYHALLMLNTILAASREPHQPEPARGKGYTSACAPALTCGRALAPSCCRHSVGTDTTADACARGPRELSDIGSGRPATDDEVALGLASGEQGLPARVRTAVQVARSAVALAWHGLADTYFEEFVPKLAAVTPADVTRVAQQYLDVSTKTPSLWETWIESAIAGAGRLGAAGSGRSRLLGRPTHESRPFHAHGGPDVLRLEEVPEPVADGRGPGARAGLCAEPTWTCGSAAASSG